MNNKLVDGAINIITYSGDAPGLKKIVDELKKRRIPYNLILEPTATKANKFIVLYLFNGKPKHLNQCEGLTWLVNLLSKRDDLKNVAKRIKIPESEV